MNFIVKTAKTAEEAISKGLEQLNKTREQVDIEILSEGKKGFLGLGSTLAEVKITPKYDVKAAIRLFLKELTIAMNLLAEIDIKENSKTISVTLSGENMGALIGKRGQVLEAIQHITNLVVNKTEPHKTIIIDTENYRQRRKENLEILALRLARRAKVSGKSISLEPMSASERRIIHIALDRETYVATRSEGDEPYRHIVIDPV